MMDIAHQNVTVELTNVEVHVYSLTENCTSPAQFRTSSVRFFDFRNWDKANCIGSRFTVRLAHSQNDTGVHFEEADKGKFYFRSVQFDHQL